MIGLDANAASMVESSRATGIARTGGLPNALFVVAAAETPPTELVGRADVVSVVFPWGSLLRGVMGADSAVLAGLAALVRPGGSLEVLTSVEARDAATAGVDPTDVADEERIRSAWAEAGLRLLARRSVGAEDPLVTSSSWGRRLAHDRSRQFVRLDGCRGAAEIAADTAAEAPGPTAAAEAEEPRATPPAEAEERRATPPAE